MGNLSKRQRELRDREAVNAMIRGLMDGARQNIAYAERGLAAGGDLVVVVSDVLGASELLAEAAAVLRAWRARGSA